MSDAQAAERDPRPLCDHICLKDAGHLERGEPHFHGYEIPSPRGLVFDRAELQLLYDAVRWHVWGEQRGDYARLYAHLGQAIERTPG